MAEEEKRKSIIDIEVKGVDDLENAASAAKDTSESLDDTAKSSSKAKQGFSELSKGVDQATGGFLTLFKALLTNPIGIIVSGLTALVAVFSRSQTGIEFFRKASAFLNTVLGKLSDIVEELGGRMIQAFEDPQQALADLVTTIQNTVVRYFTEIIPNAINTTLEGFGLLGKSIKLLFEGEFSEAADVALEGITKIGDGVTDLNPATFVIKQLAREIKDFAKEANDAANAAFELEEAMIANEKALADLEVTTAKNRVEFVKLKTASDDIRLSTEARIDAAERANAIETETLAQQEKLLKERIRILKEQNELTNSTEADIQKVRDAEIQLATVQEASYNKRLELQNKLNVLLKEERTLFEQRFEREFNAAAELAIFQQEQLGNLEKAEIARRNLLLSNAELTESERQLIIAQSEARIKEIKKDADEQEIARAKAVRDAKIKANKESFGALTGLFNDATIAGKSFALAQIGISQGEAIAGLIANAERNPAGALTFGLANALHFAAGIARIGSAISQAKQVIQSGNSLASISSSGVSGVNVSAQAASAPESTGLANVNATLLDQFAAPGRQAQLQSDAIALGISRMPSPVVYVDDINTGQNNYSVKVGEATA